MENNKQGKGVVIDTQRKAGVEQELTATGEDINSYSKTGTNSGALSTLVTVFFFWGFIAAGNGVFIPFCKNYFKLDQFQSQLVDFAFYLAIPLLCFIYAGKWLDKRTNHHFFVLIGILLALALSSYLIYRKIKEIKDLMK